MGMAFPHKNIHGTLSSTPLYGRHVYFANRTKFRGARIIIPGARFITHEKRARLFLQEIIRLSAAPVGVGHVGQFIAVRICRRHSPDECGLATWVYTLSSDPEQRSIMSVEGVT